LESNQEAVSMKWVTRKNANVDRVACPWLITKFVDPAAEFLYVAADEVMATAESEAAIRTTSRTLNSATSTGAAASNRSW
jgi:hypothetical protein